MKRCSRCKMVRPFADFGTDPRCRPCLRIRSREQRQRGIGKTQGSRVVAHLRQLYGLTYERYLEMLIAQDYRCAICRKPETVISHRSGVVKNLAVDHDHATGTVRGLLCTACNNGLARFRDNPTLLSRAITYLFEPRAT